LGVVAILGSTALYLSAELKHARLDKAHAQERFRVASDALRKLEQDAERARQLVAEQAAALASLEARNQDVLREIVRMQSTAQCARTAAVGLALERLRHWTGPGLDNRPPPAGGTRPAVSPASGTGQGGQR